MTPAAQLAAPFMTGASICGQWSLRREHPSLGGLLLLRQELEILAESGGARNIRLAFCDSETDCVIPPLAAQAFDSRFSVAFATEAHPREGAWPTPGTMAAGTFSYQFFDRISDLCRVAGRAPALSWSPETLAEAGRLRAEAPGKLVTLHLKSVPGQTERDSNAVFEHWHALLSRPPHPGLCTFMLMGGDRIPREILELPGVRSAHEEGIALPVQLALISLSDGFLGMASGISAAAILSAVPYVLFKHPLHHVAEMERELGTGKRFSFARPRQEVWRKAHTPDILVRALQLALGDEV
jgi:hypothetical protein